MKIYVDASARCDGDGSEFRPFKRINEAAKIAVAGDEVLVKPGIYREYVNPVNSGTKEAPIVYRSVEPLKAIISGAEEVDDRISADAGRGGWKPAADEPALR